MSKRDTYFAGAAAEHFVAHDIWRRGIECVFSGQNSEFDLLAFVDDPMPLRIQVKGRTSATYKLSGETKYAKHYKRYRFHGIDSQACRYENVDLLALVALDQLAIMYVPVTGQRFYTFPEDVFSAPEISTISWEYCMQQREDDDE